MKKIALVSYHFYKTKTRGGELYVLQAARVLAKQAKVTIITTQSTSHMGWANGTAVEHERLERNIEIRRFPVDFTVVPREINNLNHFLHSNKMRTFEEEMNWIKKIGPYSTPLFQYLKENKSNYDVFFFVGYANPITYFGLPLVAEKSLLRPHLHNEPSLYFKIFDDFFTLPKIILPATYAEKELIEKRFPRHSKIELFGMNINESAKEKVKLPKLNKPYVLFIGRFEPSKGVFELLEFFNQFNKNVKSGLTLYIVGEATFPVNTSKHVKYLGVVDEETKNALISNSLLLINPSRFESMSFTLFEAWWQKKPVLVNGFCNALRDQVERSNGGLYYETYKEFEAMLKLLTKNKGLRDILGKNGHKFYMRHYQKREISRRLREIIDFS